MHDIRQEDYNYELGDHNDIVDAPYALIIHLGAGDCLDVSTERLQHEVVGITQAGEWRRFEDTSISAKIRMSAGPRARDEYITNPVVFLEIPFQNVILFDKALTDAELTELDLRIKTYLNELGITNYKTEFVKTELPKLKLAIVTENTPAMCETYIV